MFRTGLLSIIRSLVLYTQQQVYVILYWTPDDGQKTCPKHVQVYSKNKFDKLVQLVGFIIRIYHDAPCSECQMDALLLQSDSIYGLHYNISLC